MTLPDTMLPPQAQKHKRHSQNKKETPRDNLGVVLSDNFKIIQLLIYQHISLHVYRPTFIV